MECVFCFICGQQADEAKKCQNTTCKFNGLSVDPKYLNNRLASGPIENQEWLKSRLRYESTANNSTYFYCCNTCNYVMWHQLQWCPKCGGKFNKEEMTYKEFKEKLWEILCRILNMSIFKNWPSKQNVVSGDTLYADIVNHCGNWKEYFFEGDKFTTAHESTHSCNADIRNDAGGTGINGFYLGFNRAIVVPEPKTRKRDCIQFIPQSLRSSRYDLYIVGQQEWDDTPLYLFDEFTAYINGAWTAIELKEKENYVENVIVDGPVEFISYAVATLMAADKANSLNDTLLDFSKWLLRHAYNSYFEGIKAFSPYDVQDKIYEIQKLGVEWESHRQFLKDKLKYEVPTTLVAEDNDPKPPIPDSTITWDI